MRKSMKKKKVRQSTGNEQIEKILFLPNRKSFPQTNENCRKIIYIRNTIKRAQVYRPLFLPVIFY